MTTELKADFDDVKDSLHQAKLEANIKARSTKAKVLETIVDKTGHKLSAREGAEGAKMIGTDLVHDAQDKIKQAALEVKIQARDAKVALDKTDAKKALDSAAISAGDKLVDAREAAIDAFTPAQKVVEAESARGVDITHVENPLNERVEARKAIEAAREARDQDRLAEEKRQKLLDDAKAKVASMKESIVATAKPIIDQVEVTLGKAALSAKEKLDDYTDNEGPRTKEEAKYSASGIDISSVQNARNDDLRARDAVRQDLAKAEDKTVGQKLSEGVAKAGEKIKAAYVEATTDAPEPLFVHKVSASGVDLSHGENANNAELARLETERLRVEKEALLARQKDVLKGEVVDPAREKAALEKDSLQSKLSALGDSISQAAHKFGDSVSAKWTDAAHPLPLDVHEQTSSNGVDTTSVANANNNAIGEEIKKRDAIVPAAAAAEPAVEPKDGLQTKVVKGVLDAGVAARHASHQVAYRAKIAAAEADIAATELKNKAALTAHEIAAETKVAAAAVQDKIAPDASKLPL